MTEFYPAITKAAAEAYKARILKEYPDAKVTIKEGTIPQWGSMIPGSPTYGRTQWGFKVCVERAEWGGPGEEYLSLNCWYPGWRIYGEDAPSTA